MSTQILMPALSPTMTEGTLARWLKHEGETIAAGDVIAEIETDKATMEVEAVDEGVLGRILVPAGTEKVAVNAPIALLVEQGEAVPAASATEAGDTSAEAAVAVPAPLPQAVTSTQAGPAPATNGHAPGADRVFATPLARRLAKAAGVDLATVTGSGPNGRIVRADVERAPAAAPVVAAKPLPAALAIAAAAMTAPHRLLPLSSMRRIIAGRLTEAKQTVPHFYLTAEVRLDALLALRGQLNAQAPKDGPRAYKLSVNDLIIKAAAVALRDVPGANASYSDAGIVLYDDVDISVAVAIPDGLITPIIRQADRLGVVAVSDAMRDLAARARAGKLKPEEFQGGGFSISNLGMYGVTSFSAIINPPQGAILAVGAGEPRAVVTDGALAVATMMSCTLSVDHRVIDGALGAQWLQAFKAAVEAPLGLLL